MKSQNKKLQSAKQNKMKVYFESQSIYLYVCMYVCKYVYSSALTQINEITYIITIFTHM